MRCLLLLAALLAATVLPAAERIPQAPPRYFNDYAGVVSHNTADTLNRQLEQYERDSSNQLLVVVYPKMESDSSVEDYTVRVAQAWKVGQKASDNGAVLFAFMEEHQLYIQVGYGLEPKLTDALSKRIVEQEIVPRFRSGDVDGGMTAAVSAMIAASNGEYKGTGATQADGRGRKGGGVPIIAFVAMMLVLRIIFSVRRRRLGLPLIIGGAMMGGNSWRNNSGGSSWGGGGGGGFSGGGGSFGGGGAGGKW